MKYDLSFLPLHKQADLQRLTQLILEAIPTTHLIVLFGSYARGTWVENDVRHDFGVDTIFSSDYDIFVVTARIDAVTASFRLNEVAERFKKVTKSKVPVQFVQECLTAFNNYIREARYFYTDILSEGIILHRQYWLKLPETENLKIAEMMAQAKGYYDVWYKKSVGFLWSAYFDCFRRDYILASFHLHQTCESCYHAIELVFTLKKPRQHDLRVLIASNKKHSELLACFFPIRSAEDERLFDLLQKAYIESRYNPQFKVTRKDIKALLPHVKLLRRITKKICQDKIRLLQEQAKIK